MTEPGKPPESVQVRVSEPGTRRWLVGPAGGSCYEDEIEAETAPEQAEDEAEARRVSAGERSRTSKGQKPTGTTNPARLPVPPHPRAMERSYS